MRREVLSIAGSVLLFLSILTTASPAAASDDPGVASTFSSAVTSQSCLDQLHAVERTKGVDADDRLCSGTITFAQSEVFTASIGDVTALAREEGLGARETAALVAAAAAGGIQYRNWTNTYWGGSVVEKHTGRTYWDGVRAWIATYRGYTGKHTCHTEGSFAVGWSVKVISCSKPGSGSSADAVYRFDASVGVQGSPITLSVGLHLSTAANGTATAWEVGG
ncbi:MAG: hypothetical protein JWP32_1666 [Schumannella sp.]|nr:hypothetical protein [Schumannella sp.]